VPKTATPWLTAADLAEYLDVPGNPDTDARLVASVAAVRAAVEQRRDEIDYSDPAGVPADVRVGALRWAGLIYQARGAPSGFTGYEAESTLYDALGAQRAEIMRLIGWRRPLTA
jgi:fermentation-respiration switch protein FrsA (DUF1100 family)